MGLDDAVDRVEEAAHEVAAAVESAAGEVWHNLTTPNKCPVCDGDRIPCPDPQCLELGDECPSCHGHKLLCENCDAEAWARFAPEIERQTAIATEVVSAEDNIISMT